ncbi:MAG: phosphoribosylamine--glycine ligase [Ignavibacteria bacterium]|nr:MAG: phosphoribosylamine--glycine ligase [Ignavibacteria bacterium]
MKVAVIGSGGREHALAWKLSESEMLKNLYIIPGNPGTAQIGKNVNLDINNNSEILNFCNEIEIDLVVIGPEQPLVNGLADELRANNILVFGPDSAASKIEAHKIFAKNLMLSAGVPTAKYIEFNTSMYNHAKDFLNQKKYPCVIKADGLAAGKGVVICNNAEEAEAALKLFFIDRIFGKSGDKILVEEFLEGEEASVFAITDGNNFICLPASQDHKRIGDNDTGKNTGGMGAYAPAPVVTNQMLNEISVKIIAPTLQALKAEGKTFTGCLYAGLIITSDGIKVIEFNCRFGDPETQAVLPLLKGDFLKLLYSAAEGKLDEDSVRYNGGSAVCIVAASLGYPGQYQKGLEIFGLDEIPKNTIAFHAGTKEYNGKMLTNGGRVLGITSILEENDLQKAKNLAYEALDKIHFANMYYRRDIADKAIKQI